MLLTIDGLAVEVEAGTTVKEAAQKAGVEIPGLCDHPLLHPHGGCRLCLVEVEGMRGYPSSCTLPASEGMAVKTNTPALVELRRTVLEMLLSEHPCICINCDRQGECDQVRASLRKVPRTIGCRYCPADGRCQLQHTVELVGLKRTELLPVGLDRDLIRSPFFDRDPNLCILCGRCVRVCQDRGPAAITFASRGFEAGIETAFGRPLEESGCTFCGACVDVCPTAALTERSGRHGGRAQETVVTVCPYCSANCSLTLEVAGGRVLRAAPAEDDLCVLGRFGSQFVHHPDRLKRPLLRKNGRLVETGWEEALAAVCRNLESRRGMEFALIISGVCSNEALFLARRLAREVMGGRAYAPDLPAPSAIPWSAGFQGPVLVLGDPGSTNPRLEARLLEMGTRVTAVTPARTRLARAARCWLSPRPGEEATVLEALTRALQDGQGAGSQTSSGQAWRVAEACGVMESQFRSALPLLQGACLVAGPDCPPELVQAAERLARAAGGELVAAGQNCNSLGAAALGLEPWDWSAPSPEIRSAYLAGCNQAAGHPEAAEKLSGLDFLVVQDLFLTETAALADVVLPAASFAEIQGTVLSPEGLLPVRRAVAPRGQSRPDWQIFARLGQMMRSSGFEFESGEQVTGALREELDEKWQCWAGRRGSGAAGGMENSAALSLRASSQPTRDGRSGSPEGGGLTLECGPSIYGFGGGTRASRVPDLKYLHDHLSLQVHPLDARALGLCTGDGAILQSSEGWLEVRVRTTRNVNRGTVCLPGNRRWNPAPDAADGADARQGDHDDHLPGWRAVASGCRVRLTPLSEDGR
ncbi:MAG: molybdopterin-dependent oxidoreductase [Methanosarcinales archaeon]|nr:molybdopterin-dependent oxidoreductase [Methanosarcinales archaeon]